MGSFSDEQRISTYWWNKSEDLRNAAALIWLAIDSPKPNTVGETTIRTPSRSIYFMLCGMSLEAILKAILIEKNQMPPKTHDLKRLADLAGVSYDAHEKDLLEILSSAVIWDGRYPVPLAQDAWDRLMNLHNEKLCDRKKLSENSKFVVLSRNNELNWDRFADLLSKATSDLFSIASWVTRE